MSFNTQSFKGVDSAFVDWLIKNRWPEVYRRFSLMWDYYQNTRIEVTPGQSSDAATRATENGKCYVQAQEYGLPSRITGLARGSGDVFGGTPVANIRRKEVVIENDIGWRINAIVDFLFGEPVKIVSNAVDAGKRAMIEKILAAFFEANGGINVFQDMALLGSVYGFVDCIIRPDTRIYVLKERPETLDEAGVMDLVQGISLDLVEGHKALPILDENDYRKIICYVQHFRQLRNGIVVKGNVLKRMFGGGTTDRETVEVTEIFSDTFWQKYIDGEIVSESENPWGFLPVVHIQNLAMPYFYEGQSEVEVLMPVQDELNTRLSDRANRITMQCFKMYLGKGIEGFADKPVSPGMMWFTDNPDASIDEFGGDANVPSEENHIDECREAMDKLSAVTPLVAGVIRSKLGTLTSAVAMKLTMLGMLTKNSRKQTTYGTGLKEICSRVLSILDTAGIYQTEKADRDVEIQFTDPMPNNLLEDLQAAQIKKELGVPLEVIHSELGYHGPITEPVKVLG